MLNKRKRKRIGFVSIISLLLTLTMVTVAFAAGESGIATVTGNGGGNAGATYGKPTSGGSWADIIQAHGDYDLVGYRVYVVDNSKTKQSDVVDLYFKYKSDTGANVNRYNTIVLGDAAETPREKEIYKTTSIDTVGSYKDDCLYVYYAREVTSTSDYILGNNFKEWMLKEDSAGITNTEYLLTYAYDDTTAQDYIDKHYKLVVEPIMYCDIWTSQDWVETEEAYDKQYTTEHYVWLQSSGDESRNGAAIDCCCTGTTATSMTQANMDAYINQKYADTGASWYVPSKYNLCFSGMLSYSKYVYAHKGYTDYRIAVQNKETALIKELGFVDSAGKALPYNKLTDSQKIKLYTKIKEKGYNLSPGRQYLTSSVSEGIKYNNTSGITFELYGDYSAVYGGDWEHDIYKSIHYVSGFTGKRVYGTYQDVINYLKDVDQLNSSNKGSDGGVMKGHIDRVGSGFCLVESDSGLSLSAGRKGIHIYDLADIAGEPIHTYDINTNPTVPDESEQPSEPKQNTGTSNIIKVYGNVYKDDSGKYHYIENYKTAYVTTNTTDEIIITDEYEKTGYSLTQWVVSSTKNTGVTATKWAKINSSSYGLEYSTLKSTLGVSAYTMKSSGKGLEHGEDNPLTIGEGNTIYLLYLKTLPAIETSKDKVPDTTTEFEPTNPTYPENPSTTPSKQGGYNIIKVYTLLDQYNGTPLSSETYTQTQTTPFIKIESESNWTLAGWYTTNTYKSTVKGEDFFTKATDSQLKAFYENGYHLKPESTIESVIKFNRQKHIIQKSR